MAEQRGAAGARADVVDLLGPHLAELDRCVDRARVVARAAGPGVAVVVARDPLDGPVLRALARAWHCASGRERGVEVTAGGAGRDRVVRVHGDEWSLLGRAGGPVLCVLDGPGPAGPGRTVVDVTATGLAGALVQALLGVVDGAAPLPEAPPAAAAPPAPDEPPAPAADPAAWADVRPELEPMWAQLVRERAGGAAARGVRPPWELAPAARGAVRRAEPSREPVWHDPSGAPAGRPRHAAGPERVRAAVPPTPEPVHAAPVPGRGVGAATALPGVPGSRPAPAAGPGPFGAAEGPAPKHSWTGPPPGPRPEAARHAAPEGRHVAAGSAPG